MYACIERGVATAAVGNTVISPYLLVDRLRSDSTIEMTVAVLRNTILPLILLLLRLLQILRLYNYTIHPFIHPSHGPLCWQKGQASQLASQPVIQPYSAAGQIRNTHTHKLCSKKQICRTAQYRRTKTLSIVQRLR